MQRPSPLWGLHGLSNTTRETGAVWDSETNVRCKRNHVLQPDKSFTCNRARTQFFFYGSQTGTAEDYASRLAKEASTKYGLRVMTADLEECDMNLLDRLPREHVAFFLLATYGEGEPTDNATAFWELLMDEDVPTFSRQIEGVLFEDDEKGKPLKNLSYVIFGLGNKTYEHYNAVARKVNAKLEFLGAKRIGNLGEGDDDVNIEDDFMNWKGEVLDEVAKLMGLDKLAGGGANDGPSPATYALIEHEGTPEKNFMGIVCRGDSIADLAVNDSKNPFLARIALTRELFAAESGRHCVHVELDISDSSLSYEAGDHVAIYPMNPDSEVERLGKVMGLWEKKDKYVTISKVDTSASKPQPFPVPSTYETILRHYLDVTAVPSRDMLASLASYFPNESAARAYLARLATDKEEYTKTCVEGRTHLGEIFEEVTAMQGGEKLKGLPLFVIVVEGLGRLQPRYYSISSSAKMFPSTIHVTASVLQYSSAEEPCRLRYGVCTNYLLALHYLMTDDSNSTTTRAMYSLHPAGTKVEEIPSPGHDLRIPIFVRRSNFKLPKDPSLPVVMVGPGTGVAPFRGFVQERRWQRQSGLNPGPTLLFFGCRRRDEDYLYREEWAEALEGIHPTSFSLTAGAPSAEMSSETASSNFSAHSDVSENADARANPQDPPSPTSSETADAAIFVAFSREHPNRKYYVQHRLYELRSRVWQLLGPEGNGSFYVCGDAKHMAHDVNKALHEIAKVEGKMDEEQAIAFVKELRSSGRYLEDVWS